MENKIQLNNITLVLMSSVKIEESIKALEYSCKGIDFGAVKLISDIKPDNLPEFITWEYIDKINNIDEWNYSIIYKLGNYINTEFAILIHDDGYIINPSSWREEFLNYDYIGAPFPLPNDNFSFRDINNDLIRVGNSVSLRSKKLIDLPNKLNLEWKAFHGFYNEDGFICVNYRHKYLENGCNFADINVAKYFSHERFVPENQGIIPFAFHGKYSEYNNLKFN
jgi:hypothetical protein